MAKFPHLRVGTFIEAADAVAGKIKPGISPPSGGDFH